MFVNIPKFIQDFIDELDLSVRAKLLEVMEIIRIGDYVEAMSYSKKIDDGLYELRIKSVTHARIFFTFIENQMFLLHAIVKKTWKIPKKELEIARNRLKLLRDVYHI